MYQINSKPAYGIGILQLKFINSHFIFFNFFFCFRRKPNLMKQNGLNFYEMYQINSKPACGHTWLEVHAIPISMLNKKSNVMRPSISKKCIKFNWNEQINSQQSFEIENFCTKRNAWWVPMGSNGSWPASSDSRSPPNWVRPYSSFSSQSVFQFTLTKPSKTQTNLFLALTWQKLKFCYASSHFFPIIKTSQPI